MIDPKTTTNQEFGDIPKADFQKHLDDTAEKVSNMPKWKQDVIQERKPMPNTNEEIALKLGYEKDEYGDWYSPTDIPLRYPPDYEREWAHAGPLWGEMVRALGLTASYHRILNQLTNHDRISSDDELKAAISHAWLAWKKEGK